MFGTDSPPEGAVRQADRLGRTHDWVVLYCRDGDGPKRRYPVVTEFREPLRGKRVVRGRERECAAHYRMEPAPDDFELWLEDVMR